MDRGQFDTLARIVGARQSRRGAIATILGAAVLSQHVAGVDAKRRKRKPKEKNRDKDAADPGSGSCHPGTNCQPGRGTTNAGCDFSRSDLFRNLNARGAVLTGANFSGADLTGADLRGAVLRNACLAGADLTNAAIDQLTVLSGATFCNTTMPDGSLDNSGCNHPTTCCPTGQHCTGGDCTCDAAACQTAGGCCDGDTCNLNAAQWLPQTTFGTGGAGPGEFNGPIGLAVGAGGQTVWVAELNNNRVSIWTTSGGDWVNQTSFGSRGSGLDQFRLPSGLAVSGDERTIWVADNFNSRISIWTNAGSGWANQTTFGSGPGSGPRNFNSPLGVAISADEQTAWVADSSNSRISIWRKSGGGWTNQSTFGSFGFGPDQFFSTDALVVSADEQTIWVADGNSRISIWHRTGSSWTHQTNFGSGGSGPRQLRLPRGLAVSADERTVWVADTNNNRISVWTRTGSDWVNQTTFGGAEAGPNQLSHPTDVVVSADERTVWVADFNNNRVSVWVSGCPVSSL